MRTKSKFKSFLSVLLALTMLLSTFPLMTYAAQSNEYVDPADNWLQSNNRTNELDVNATITSETQWCSVCMFETEVHTFRVPEYTKSGETALNRGVRFSDGTLISGEGTGNLDDGTPGIDAYLTGYHWTKTVCQNCGTLNTVNGSDYYSFNRNVYGLNSCDENFFLEFDNTTHEMYDEEYHLTTLKRGEYCKFCKGTFARATTGLQDHDYIETVDSQIGNNRFYIRETCTDCGFESSEYITAKSIVASYYGVADGEAHTLTVSNLSDRGVSTSILYGNDADSCTKTSAPNYTKPGHYTVYYKINYTYAGETMTENGVSYVSLIADDSEDESDDTVVVLPTVHEHEYHYLETVAPNCGNLGYDRFQCNGCGDLMKTNYTQSTGHDYSAITIREATCKQGGLKLWLCSDCGDFYEETTPLASHSYKSEKHNPTCRITGYTEHICEVCGDNYITNITPIINHSFEGLTKESTCIDNGYTSYTCTMCSYHYVSDHTDATGHAWDDGHTVTGSTCEAEGVIEFNCLNKGCTEKMIKATDATGHTPGKEATCTEPQRCEVCQTVLELPLGHDYTANIIQPTCTAMGYTVYTCHCGDTYTGNYTDMAAHDYDIVVTNPTCTEHGFSTYTCVDCGDNFVSDYNEKLSHNYKATVTEPTCTSMGFTTYICEDCTDTYKGNYVDMREHNFNKKVVDPTCTEHGYSIFECPDCGKSYIDEIVDCTEHHYVETVIPATCTTHGYSIFKCDDCQDEYEGNYTEKAAHDYEKTVTPATCTSLGFTTHQCKNCDDNFVSDYTDKISHSYTEEVTAPGCLTMGYSIYTCSCGHNYKGNYVEALGHDLSDWIIDIPATIEQAGSKHIECLRCGETLHTVAIPQLIDEDRSDEDGNAAVGDYSIVLTDKDGKPIFDSEITIDALDNVTIKLPDGRLLDYNDQTTVTVFRTGSQAPVTDLKIFIYDKANNAATGSTNADGQVKFPNNQSSTGDDNGTIGGGDEDEKFTYVVTVTNKENIITSNCDIWIGESNNIVVDLPAGVKPTCEEPVIVTVTDHNGQAHEGVSVIVLGDSDFIEKGKTDIYGKVTLPMTNEGYTDEDGKVNVQQRNVIVNDELGLIPDAYVVYNEDGTVDVTLPEGKLISYANRITVTVLDSMGKPINEVPVTVKDTVETSYSANTDENGKIVVPPLSEDITDSDGKAVVNGYNVLITDETKPIENAFIVIKDNTISVALPEGAVIDINNRITATVTDKDGNPVKDMPVAFTDKTEKTETNLTDENGKATVPPTNIDVTDVNGYGEVDGYIITVSNEAGFIEKAFITHTEDGKLDIKLPEGILLDYHNRVTVSVANKSDNSVVKDMSVTVTETIALQTDSENDASDSAASGDNAQTNTTVKPEPKTMTGITDHNGKVVFPPKSEDVTDDKGDSGVTEDKPGAGEDTDGDGKEDKPGDVVTTTYKVSVSDTKGIVANSFIKIEDGKVYVTLPDTHTLTTSNQTTVTVLDKDDKPVSNVSVTVTDKNEATATRSTDSNGKVTVPVKSSGGSSGGGSSSGSSGGGGGGGYSVSTVNVKVVDKDGKTVSVSKSTGTDKVTLTLPTGKDLTKDDNYYVITVTDRNGKAKADYSVVLKDRKGNEVKGETDDDGVLTLPAVEHKAYIVGYGDGSFRPENDMTRGEAAAIFARLIAEAKGETISGKSSFKDVSNSDWHSQYVGYLEKYDVINGYEDKTFRPDAPVTRAEFVVMAVRYHGLFNKVEYGANTTKYTDVNSNYWAVKDISYAKSIGWLNGYADGTFRGDNNITRAEVVTVVNRATGRTADKEYVNANLTKLNQFTDLKGNSHWASYDIYESANDHMAISGSDSETWVK